MANESGHILQQMVQQASNPQPLAVQFDPKDAMKFPVDWLVIVIGGRFKSGKDTAADYIQEKILHAQREWGMYSNLVPYRIAFADELKRDIMKIFGLSRDQLYTQALKEQVDPRWGFTPRYLMQWYGATMRSLIARIWVTRMENNILQARGLIDANWQPSIPNIHDGKRPVVIISDGRHINEAVPAYNHSGGMTIHVLRDDQPIVEGGIKNHQSEGEWERPEAQPFICHTVHNPGPSVPNSLKGFQESVYNLIKPRLEECDKGEPSSVG